LSLRLFSFFWTTGDTLPETGFTLTLPRRSPNVDEVLRLAAVQSAPIELRLATPERRVPARVERVDPAALRLTILAPGTPDALPSEGDVVATLHVGGRAWAFEGSLSRTGADVWVARPARLRAVQPRASARIPAVGAATVLFANGDRVLRRRLVDLSAGGLGVEFKGTDDEPASGAALAQVQFSLPIGPPLTGAAVVRHVRRVDDGARHAGLDLIGMSPADARRLDAWVRGQTRTGRRAAATEAAHHFADLRIELPGGDAVRRRAVADASARGVTFGALSTDRELTVGARLGTVGLWWRETCVVRAPADVIEAVTHRGRPMQVRIAWREPAPEAVDRLAGLLRQLRRT
jgi:hypothetical protein